MVWGPGQAPRGGQLGGLQRAETILLLALAKQQECLGHWEPCWLTC